MNFFENQDRARQNTQKLIGLFALSIAVMIVAIFYIASLFFFRLTPRIWWHPELFLAVAVTTIAMPLATTSWYRAC